MVLLTVLRKAQRKEKQARILILGLDNAGKSTLVARLRGESLDDVQPTLGFQIRTISNDGLTLNMWDVGGQQSLRPFWHNYFEKTDFLVWVVDASAPHRMESCVRELHAALKSEEDRLVGAGLLIWVNKIDMYPGTKETVEAEFAKRLELDSIARNHSCRVIACSAYTGEGVSEGIQYVTEEIRSRLYSL